jgi:site-specific recombinase XerC
MADKPQSDLERWKNRFLTYIEVERNKSLLTRRNYDLYLTKFIAVTKLTKPEQITLDDVRDFRLWLNRQANQRGGSLKKSTQNYYLIALRSFLKYLVKQDIKSLAAEKIDEPFAPSIIKKVSRQFKMPTNRILVGSIHHFHPFDYEDMGGVRIII